MKNAVLCIKANKSETDLYRIEGYRKNGKRKRFFFLLSQIAELDNQTTDDDECKADPGGGGDEFFENVLTTQDADQCKKGDVDPEQLGKIPLHCIHHEAVCTEDDESTKNQKESATSQAASNECISGNFK